MIRFFDFIFSLAGIIFLLPVGMVIYILGLLETGSPIFKQARIGKKNKIFTLLKFRTMTVGTKSVATHLAERNSITRLGKFLRKSKLDELPQLINVLLGQMSLVGPRPNLTNQNKLIKERRKRGVYEHLPGITGLAQINEIDMSSPIKLAETDAEMIKSLTLRKYFYYIIVTITGKGSGDRVKN